MLVLFIGIELDLKLVLLSMVEGASCESFGVDCMFRMVFGFFSR